MPEQSSHGLRLLAVIVLLATLACGSDDKSPTDPGRPLEPTQVVIAQESLVLTALGDTARLTATVKDQKGTAIVDASITWSSTDTTVVKVNASGRVAAIGNGSANVVARVAGVADTVSVKVEQVPVSIEVSPDSVRIAAGDSVRLTAAVADRNGAEIRAATLNWTSADTSVVKVDGAGLIRAVAEGRSEVLVSAGEATGRVKVTVTAPSGDPPGGGGPADPGDPEDPVPASLEVTPSSAAFDALGDSVQVRAVVRDSDGVEITDVEVAWSSSDPAVATVSPSGWVVARGNGTARIVAKSGELADTARIEVAQVPVSLEVSPKPVRLGEGDTLRLEVVVKDANGAMVEGAAITWKSTFAAVVSVDGTGLVTAKMRGYGARVVAESEALSDSVSVRVMDQIAYRESDGIYLMNEDGSNRRKITSRAGDVPVWSPTGHKMVYVVTESGRKTLYRVDDFDGTDQVLAFADHPNSSQRIEWSRAGDWIIHDHKYHNAPNPMRVIAFKATGSGGHTVAEDEYENHSPTSSPDGKKVAYLSRRDGVIHIMTANLDGTNKRSLFSGQYIQAPAWSPWGDQIAFSRMVGTERKIFVINVDGTGLREIGPGQNPQWAPIGKRILAATPGASPDLYIHDLNESTSTKVLSATTITGLPRWSPDGGRILFASDGSRRLNILHLDRGEVEDLGSFHGWSMWSYAWRPREAFQIVIPF